MSNDDLARNLELLLAGGRGSRLKHLTDSRAKPAVYFGGKFRIIDFTLSNCLNSGIRRVAVVTQYKSHSLIRHIQRGWAFLKSEMNEFVDLLPAQQRLDDESWYRGTADAIFQNIDIVQSYSPSFVVVLAGDHVYKMNYALMLAHHAKSGAECTVGCIEVPRQEASAFGVMGIDATNRITSFAEKPSDPAPMPEQPDRCLASMGIYVFNADWLYRELRRDLTDPNSSHDFGHDIVPRAVQLGVAVAHPFALSCVVTESNKVPYWRDVGTIDSYWESNIDLTATYQEQLPPAKFVHNLGDRRGSATESMVSGGCIISGSLNRSLLFSKCRIHSWSLIDWSVLLPDVQVGRHARLTRCVVDRGCQIPEGMVIGEDPELDAQRFYRTPGGITLISQEMLARLEA